jgi:signal peptidase I
MALVSNRHRLSSRDRLSSIHRRNILIIKVLFSFILFMLFLTFILSTVQSGSVSMEPTLSKGTRSVFHPLQKTSGLERGDVVLIETPYYGEDSFISHIVNRIVGFFSFQKIQVSLYPRESWLNRYLIKRVVAIPGDTIKMENWIIYIKAKNDSYFLSEFERSTHEYDVIVDSLNVNLEEGDLLNGDLEEIILNEGEFFVLGDNRRLSNDSYYWGVLPEEKIKGKLLFIYWPFSLFGVIH